MIVRIPGPSCAANRSMSNSKPVTERSEPMILPLEQLYGRGGALEIKSMIASLPEFLTFECYDIMFAQGYELLVELASFRNRDLEILC